MWLQQTGGPIGAQGVTIQPLIRCEYVWGLQRHRFRFDSIDEYAERIIVVTVGFICCVAVASTGRSVDRVMVRRDSSSVRGICSG